MAPPDKAPKPRTIAPGPGNLPNDKGFAARSANDDKARAKDAEAVPQVEPGDILSLSNAEKIAFYEALAQQTANDLGCSVLLHWLIIPHHEHTPPTMSAVLVPAIERDDIG